VACARRPPPRAPPGAPPPPPAAWGRHELVADQLDGAEVAAPIRGERGGREQKAQHHALAVPGGSALGVGAQDLHVAPARGVLLGLRVGHRERALELLRVHDHVGVGELAELQQLGVREGCLGGAAAADHHDLRDPALGEHLECVVSCVRGRELGGREHEHARHVDRHVAVSDDDRALCRQQVDLEVGVVGMAVVPADELRRSVRPGEVFAGDPQRPIRR